MTLSSGFELCVNACGEHGALPGSALDPLGRRAEVNGPLVHSFSAHGHGAEYRALCHIGTGKKHAISANHSKVAHVDGAARGSASFGRDHWTQQSASSVIVTGRVNLYALAGAAETAECERFGCYEMTASADVDAASKRHRSRGYQRCKPINPNMISDADVLKADDRTVLCDLHIFANVREPEAAQFIGAIIPRIEWIAHVGNMPESGDKVKLAAGEARRLR